MIFCVGYFVSSLTLIIWSEAVSYKQPELGIFCLSVFGVMTFPISYLVGFVASTLNAAFWPAASSLIEVRIVTGLILITGYFQWFIVIPWIFKKIRRIF